MLTIEIKDTRTLFDDATNEFVYIHPQTLQFEHSLVSLSKWEAKWKKPFLDKGDKTTEETLDYIKCMTLTPHVKPEVYLCLTADEFNKITDYIGEDRTATTFSDSNKGRVSREKITSELIYYWMIAFNIPQEYQKWHLSRLLTLIRICNIKNSPPKKMRTSDIMNRNSSLNAARRAKLHSKG